MVLFRPRRGSALKFSASYPGIQYPDMVKAEPEKTGVLLPIRLRRACRKNRSRLKRVQSHTTSLVCSVMTVFKTAELIVAIFFLLAILRRANAGLDSKRNVLFIVVDDLRPQLGCYGQSYMHTPNIDGLAKESLLFERAYCQFSFCAPSRNSFMTGRRPDRTKAWSFRDHFREPGIGENWTSLPQFFKKHGYFTVGVGKLYHPGLPPNYDPPSWTDEQTFPYVNPQPQFCPQDASRCALDKSNNFSDILTLQAGLERLRYAAQHKDDRPFFLGVGFHKPHLPFRVPAEFMNMYNLEDVKPPSDGSFPQGSPPVAWNDCWRVWPRPFSDTNVTAYSINTSMNMDDVLGLRRGYYAAVSFTDSLIGQLLQELESLGLANDTIVSLHADHGWQLGEVCQYASTPKLFFLPKILHSPGCCELEALFLREKNTWRQSHFLDSASVVFPGLRM